MNDLPKLYFAMGTYLFPMLEEELGELTRENRGCPFEIQFCGWMEHIYPWIQNELETPFWRLYWSVRPGGTLRFGSTEMSLEPNTFVLIPAGFRFPTFARSPFEQVFLHFNFNDLVRVYADRIATIPGDEFSAGYIQEFVGLYRERKDKLRCEMIGYLLLGHALLKSSAGPVICELPLDRRIVETIRYIGSNPASRLDNELLADRCGMARNAFIRLFSGAMKESPQAFVRAFRRGCQKSRRAFLSAALPLLHRSSGFTSPGKAASGAL